MLYKLSSILDKVGGIFDHFKFKPIVYVGRRGLSYEKQGYAACAPHPALYHCNLRVFQVTA